MELTFECTKRTSDLNPRAMRREGLLPAALYGHDGVNSVDLMLNMKDAELLVRKVKGKRTPVQLNVTDMPWSGTVFVQEVQSHPWRGSLYHVSFFASEE
ncbi:50S ribosomal protein L25 [Leptolyngbya sp. CCY15150]|uniref:50S ribosomal protein L25 n=1 Tax=Leptolyngbya sp. CCY15150 TaxID=2767772 RepID=UPI00194E79B8|nr:50S ribosomal protein L25 [Leptolyngbya sp. CCY15150]